MTFRVMLTEGAASDLRRLYRHKLEQTLDVDGTIDFEPAERALEAIRSSLDSLERNPFTCRKAGTGPFLRELIIPHGNTGYVALFEIMGSESVAVVAIRHQREDDYR